MPSRAWPLLLVVIVLTASASVWLATTLPLIDPDEGRNAEIAREMASDGDLVIPHLAGMPYLDKPPGFFWAAAIAVRTLGATPLAARLPALLAAALTLMAMARLALRESGSGSALRATLLLASAPLFTVLSAYVIFDMPLTLCVTVMWIALARELEAGAETRRRAVMFAAVTLGLLIKGPVMLAWAVGGSLGATLLLRRRDPLRWLAWWPGWLMVLAIAGGWFALATARHPEYPHYAFLEETLERMSSGSFRREQPWWFVPAVLAGGALPWSLATPWLRLRRASSDAKRAAPIPSRVTLRVALGFVLFAAVFFTLSRSKLVTYLLPALPPLAWLAASAWSDARPQRGPGWVLFALFLALAAGCETASRVGVPWLPAAPSASGAYRALAIGLALASLAALGAALTRRTGLAFASVLMFTPILLGLGWPLLSTQAAAESGAPLAQAILALGGGPTRYEACYSPGTDYLLGRRGMLVGVSGQQFTSNYQLRYRRALVERGLWTPLATPPADDPARVVVRSAGAPGAPPAGWIEFFRDRRFVAYRPTHRLVSTTSTMERR